MLSHDDDDDFEVPTIIMQRRVSGVIVIGKIKDKNIEKICRMHTQIVLVDHASMVENIDSIITDNKHGSYMLVKYLLEKGFTKIGFYGELSYSLSIKERYLGYREALSTFLGVSSWEQRDSYIDKYSILEGMEEAVLSNNNKEIVELIKRHETMPEVFVCSNDRVAISLMVALQILGYKIPEDISIVGFDNIDICEKICPKLTTVNVNKELMGKRAVQRLIYRLSHRNSLTENVAISVEMVERESVGKPER